MNSGTLLDTAANGKLPWPVDALMIVASRLGTEHRAAMEAVVSATCRHCEAELAADTRTLRTAETLPERADRPIMFFCVECCVLHDRGSLDLLVDQRDRRNDVYRKGSR